MKYLILAVSFLLATDAGAFEKKKAPIRNQSTPQDAQLNIGTATIRGNLTARGHFASSGPVTLGDAAGDNLDIRGSSITLFNGPTVYALIDSFRIVNPSPTICHNFIYDDDGDLEIIVSSSPTGIGQNFSTQTITSLATSNAKVAFIEIFTSYTGDGTPTTADLSLYATSAGSNDGILGGQERCRSRIVAANERGACFNTFPIKLNASKQFLFLCQPSSIETTQVCSLKLAGWCE